MEVSTSMSGFHDDDEQSSRPARGVTKMTKAETGAIQDAQRAIAMVNDVENEHPNTWERGESFLDDVRKKLKEVLETINRTGRVTVNQQRAIENWANGVRAWHPEHRGT